MPPSPKIGSLIQGNKGKYRLDRIITEGNMSWSIEAVDVANGNNKVFLKYYKSPTPKVDWYGAYVGYVGEINKRLEASKAAQYCVLCRDLFTANPKPDMCRAEYLYQTYDFIDSGCDLRGMIDKESPDWEKRKSIAKVFLVSMRNIHDSGVVHCDLKPENVQMVPKAGTKLGLIPRMIDMDRSILADVRAPWVDGRNPEGYTGTPGYMSPEHVSGKVPTTASDVFTVGLILSELLAGIKPFGRYAEPSDYKNAVLSGGKFERVKLLGSIGDEAANADAYARLIEKCFDPNPSRRPTCDQLHKELLRLDQSASRSEPLPPPSRPEPPKKPEAARATALCLAGDAGVLKVLLNMDLGKYSLGSATTQARFATREQFHVERKGDRWYIRPCSGSTPNATALNGVMLEQEMPLSNGDEIALMGRSSGKMAMQLKVSFE